MCRTSAACATTVAMMPIAAAAKIAFSPGFKIICFAPGLLSSTDPVPLLGKEKSSDLSQYRNGYYEGYTSFPAYRQPAGREDAHARLPQSADAPDDRGRL